MSMRQAKTKIDRNQAEKLMGEIKKVPYVTKVSLWEKGGQCVIHVDFAKFDGKKPSPGVGVEFSIDCNSMNMVQERNWAGTETKERIQDSLSKIKHLRDEVVNETTKSLRMVAMKKSAVNKAALEKLKALRKICSNISIYCTDQISLMTEGMEDDGYLLEEIDESIKAAASVFGEAKKALGKTATTQESALDNMNSIGKSASTKTGAVDFNKLEDDVYAAIAGVVNKLFTQDQPVTGRQIMQFVDLSKLTKQLKAYSEVQFPTDKNATTKVADDNDWYDLPAAWEDIVASYAKAVAANSYAHAVEEALSSGDLETAPWGGGQDIMDFVPEDAVDQMIPIVEEFLNGLGKEAVLKDYVAFAEATSEGTETYGHNLAMEQMGHGVGLEDYNYTTTLPKQHTEAYGYIEDGEVTLYFNNHGISVPYEG